MTLKEFKSHFSEQLSSIYPQTEVDTFFFLLIEEYLGFQRIDLVMQPNFEISSEKEVVLNEALNRLQTEEPIQYILGKTEFYGFPFKVTSNTLIPRPETEELVEWILKEVDTNKKLNIIDIGTGTGCIPISLKKHLPNAVVSAVDVSKEALKIALQNAVLNEVTINFIEQDILTINSLDEILKQVQNDDKLDVIVSNPPYVRNLEKVEIKDNVLQNEPHLALFVEDDDPLLFYNKITDLAKNHLSEQGLLFFEINQYLGNETVEILKNKGFSKVELRKDLFGNDRMIKASL